MKRSKRRNKSPRKPNTHLPAAIEADDPVPARRQFLGKIGKGALAVLVAGGGSWYMINDVRATMCEHDLSKIGNGMPTIVQIHDPQCPRCVALQRETRDAICEIGEAKLQFLVANIRTAEGRKLASAHGVGHVTLLLFDGAGKRRTILSGPKDAEYLSAAFRYHLDRYGKG